MSDGNFSIPPQVDFTRVMPSGYTALMELRDRATKLRNTIALIEQSQRDVAGYGEEGKRFAGYAVAAASVIMVTDIARIGCESLPGPMGTGYRFLFKRWDTLMDAARKALEMAGQKTTTKADLVKGIDHPTAKKIIEVRQAVTEARGLLKSLKKVPNKQITVVLNIAEKMADDTALMIQAGAEGTKQEKLADFQIRQMANQIAHLRFKLSEVERALQELIAEGIRKCEELERKRRLARTA